MNTAYIKGAFIMNTKSKIQNMTLAALLCAVGILIPIISPVKIPIGPFGSFTLASHVAIFIAMFLSPVTAVLVALGTTVGFFFNFPLPVVMRALSHVIFAFLGATYLKKYPLTLLSFKKATVFSIVIAVIHALCEVLVIMPLFIGGNFAAGKGFLYGVLIPVGLITIIHSLVDFTLATAVWKGLEKARLVSRPTAAQAIQ